jgi:hypothetical protein
VRGAALLAAAFVAAAAAGPSRAFERREERAPCADFDPLRRPFFGDLHVHTALSFDAWGQGTRNRPRDAYRFARGEELGLQPYAADGEPGRRARLRRPLDFAAVTDHAELLGELRICTSADLAGYGSFVCRLTRRWPWLAYLLVNGQIFDVRDPERYGFCGPGGERCLAAAEGPWREIQEAAEAAYDRSAACRFTSFVAYEWSGNPDSKMIHRNVVFRGRRVPARPASYVEDRTPERLWERLRSECLEAAPAGGERCDVLAIPHNPNLSGGLLFETRRADGSELGRADAALREDLEPLLEVMQHKGDSECRAGAADELCAFEKLPFATMRESVLPWTWSEPPPRSFAREVLAAGLAEAERLGVNPFRLGLIAATDTHLGTPGLVDEEGFPGHAAGPVTARTEVPPLPDMPWFNPGGLAGVWAEENARDALFEALRRREVFGTSGPRIVVRFFGGFGLPEDLCAAPDLAARGYAHGAPMGGTLAGPATGAPRFAVAALRDPGSEERPGTPLQRLQIVKLSVKGGVTRERVYEVAGDAAGRATVDPATCRSEGPGFPSLCGVWRDPDFDPSAQALWYARVVEVPSCRWTAYACRAQQVDCARGAPRGLEACCDAAVPKTIQERAWTSPIWYAAPP